MRIAFALPLLLLATPALAQRTDDQLWLQANGNVPLGGPARVTIESIARFGDRAGGLAHTEFGGLFNWKLSKSVEIAAGYRHVEDYDHDRQLPNEERMREQVLVQLNHLLTARVRLEQRFSSAGPDTGHRVRGQLRLVLPFNQAGVALTAANETFENLNDTGWGQRTGIERMRNSVGLQFPLARLVRGELLYMNQYRFGRAGARDQMDHIASFTLTLRP
jgi:hypothetical protein